MSALAKKSWRDLTRHKARTIFTTLTVALGVMGIGLFAIMPLADRAVERELDAENMHNVGVQVSDLVLSPEQIDDLRAIPNIAAMETISMINVPVTSGDESVPALIVGVPDYDEQVVDIVRVESGEAPGTMQLLTDQGNEANAVLTVGVGDTVTVEGPTDTEYELEISGVGKNFQAGGATRGGVGVFYADIGTVWSLAERTGFTSLVFDLEDADRAAIDATVEDLRDFLVAEADVVAFEELADVREEGYWEGREVFSSFMNVTMILAILILFVSIFLIGNTLNTMISEQKREIAMMKAIGATRGRVFRSFLTTSAIIGVVGSVVGAFLGVFVAFWIGSTFAKEGFGFSPSFAVHWPTVALSLAVGIGVVILASLPALVRTLRMTVIEGLESQGISADYGQGFLDRAIMGLGGLPRVTQMGMRNALRRKGRSISTILQVGFAVGVVLAMLVLGSQIIDATVDVYKTRTWNIWTFVGDDPNHRITAADADIALSVDGVEAAEPFVRSDIAVNDRTVVISGYAQDTWALAYETTLLSHGQGRWWTEEEAAGAAPVMVVGEALARYEGIELGDTIEVMTATGAHEFEVIGIDPTFLDNGQIAYAPIETLQDVLKMNDAVTGFYLTTATDDEDRIDEIAVGVVDAYEDEGFRPDAVLHYVLEQENIEANETLSTMFLSISFIVVLIVLIGLMSTLVMNILDRTTEIGMLRCIGARARDIKHVFSAEALFLAAIGWIVGVPIGFALSRLLTAVASEAMKLTLPDVFPLSFVAWSLGFTIVGTLIVIFFPLRRAAKMRPGDAIRYE